jgi:CDP-diacylglycerol--serine O-phosphatidyltransferase
MGLPPRFSLKGSTMTEQHGEPQQPAASDIPLIGEHVEEVQDAQGRKVRHRGVYLLPNLFTTAALFAGFYAIVNAIAGDFASAAPAIFIAMVLDGLDGRVARLTNTQSAFGAEYDSLSDMVAFGVAPSLLAFEWALGDLGKFGWTAAFIYMACAALRLARFNTQIGSVDKRYFIGLASPAAASVVAGSVWVCSSHGVTPDSFGIGLAIVVALSGLLMVSNFKYNSFKQLDLKGRVPFVFILGAVLLFAVILIDPAAILLLLFFAYAASAPLQQLLRRVRKTT